LNLQLAEPSGRVFPLGPLQLQQGGNHKPIQSCPLDGIFIEWPTLKERLVTWPIDSNRRHPWAKMKKSGNVLRDFYMFGSFFDGGSQKVLKFEMIQLATLANFIKFEGLKWPRFRKWRVCAALQD
jgi:hypothetical protein